jgi:serine/threonine-protein kinase
MRAQKMESRGLSKIIDGWREGGAGALGPGTTLGRYELLLPIGMGGMACVWAARLEGHRGFSKLVAVKTILPHHATDPDFERMLLDEARIAADVRHPNVCSLFDVGEERGTLYLVLEWINGDSLLHILRSGQQQPVLPIDVRIAARIVADACAGLHAAHELSDYAGRHLNVVHRDVSPHNILVSLDGTVKIADFGIAKANGQLHQPTLAGELRGKLPYMSPEQIGSGPIDRRADVFAMGCVLYEATTGTQPFCGDNEARVIRAIVEGTKVRPDQVVPGYSPELAAIVERALEPDPAARFATAEAMRVALEEWLVRSGCVLAGPQIGDLVRQRIGPKLDRRWNDVRVAMDARGGPESTRRVLAPVPAPRLPPAAGAPETPAPQGERALSPASQANVGVSPAPVPSGARSRWLAGAAAVATLAAVLAAAWTVVSRSIARPADVSVIAAPEHAVARSVPSASVGEADMALSITTAVAAAPALPSSDVGAPRRPAPAHVSPRHVDSSKGAGRAPSSSTPPPEVPPANPY